MSAQTSVVQLEAFEAPLRGRRIRWFRSPTASVQYPPGFQEQCFAESPPFQRRVLLSAPQSSEAWKLLDRWDAIILPTAPVDWSLAITLIQNQAQPCLVLVTPEVRIPSAFFTKLQSVPIQKAPTLVHIQNLTLPLQPPIITQDATMLPPFTQEDSQLEAVQALLAQSLSVEVLRNFVLKDACRDLRSAGATLVISSIDDATPNLQWQQAAEQRQKKTNFISQLLETVGTRDF